MNRLDSIDQNIANDIAIELEACLTNDIRQWLEMKFKEHGNVNITRHTWFQLVPMLRNMLVTSLGTAIMFEEGEEVFENWAEEKALELSEKIYELLIETYPKKNNGNENTENIR